MKFFKHIMGGLCAAAITTAGFSASSAAAPEKVLVSNPPLHSLVATLLEGVDAPGLLYNSEADLQQTGVNYSALARIGSAKMVIWVGSEYEQARDRMIAMDPSIAIKSLTLTKTIPIHSITAEDHTDRPTGRHDMRFWLDPKLTVMAIRRIAPSLVKIYPEQINRILDNEIALIARVKTMNKSMRKALNSKVGVPLHAARSEILYLSWRFNLALQRCQKAAAISNGFQGTPGSGHYFSMMADLTRELQNCRNTLARADS